MPKRYKVRELIRIIETAGWQYHHTTGDHRIYYHPTLKGSVTIAGHMNDVLAPKTARSILNQAGINWRDV
jgi:predicted RNA binding protein YcfA (HicA-like mRNA interferase family)